MTTAAEAPRQLTVLLWLWKGWRPDYTARHVHAMAKLLRVFLPGARIVVVTDNLLPDCCRALVDWSIPLPEHPLPEKHRKRGPFDCWVRLHQCDESWLVNTAGVHPLAPVMSLDLDCVPVADMWELITRPAARAIAMRSASAVLNPSLLWQAYPGVLQDAWDELSVTAIARIPRHIVGSDQAWLSHIYADRGAHPWMHLLTRDDGVYVHAARMGKRPAPPILWSFAGQRKPWHQAIRVTVPLAHKLWAEAAESCESGTKRPRPLGPVSVPYSALCAVAPALEAGPIRQTHIQRAAVTAGSPVLTENPPMLDPFNGGDPYDLDATSQYPKP